MKLEPKDLYEKLEFDKILHLLEKECLGELGMEQVRQLPLSTDAALLNRQLDEVWECKLGLTNADPLPLAAYEDLAPDLKMLDIEGYVLPEEGWKRLNTTLLTVRELFKYFSLHQPAKAADDRAAKNERHKIYPHLLDILRPVHFDEILLQAIGKVFDEAGNIRPDASPALATIRREIIARQRDLDKVFRSLVNEYRNKGWLSDSVESVRNNRRVLSVPAEHKRKIRGIIHDESATGRTAFIEPEPIIEINNDIFDLQQEERREVWRILKELSATFRPYTPQLRTYQALLVRFDLIHAKARLAVQMNANKPNLVAGGSSQLAVSGKAGSSPNNQIAKSLLGIEMGRHPLLLLKNRKTGKEVVPFDLHLKGENRIVVLSGPNAGGKSILMKSVGLIQLMLQAGMLVPVDEISEMGIFENIFADIGDSQSLEDDLSTYSSRLRNMRAFLDHADERTLVLIDEFGSGTDPKIGGAIAEAILQELNERKVFGVITTHYSNLKMFAFKTPGILNGSMLFDKEHLSPTYRFKAGRPGSSYAFEIAQKSGLHKKILAYARHRTGKNEMAVDDLLIDLQREKKEVEDKLQTLSEREKQLEKLIKSYDDLHRDLEFRRKKFKLEAKEQALQEVARDNKELERLIREIREAQNLEKAKQVADQARQERQKLEATVQHLKEEIYAEPKGGTPAAKLKEAKKGELAPGDFVRMKNGGTNGILESISKNKAILQVGQLRLTVNLRDLEHAREPLDIQAAKSVQTDTVAVNAGFDTKLDIRGVKPEEALKMVEDFMDKALMTSTSQVRIVHGKGTGALRNAVRHKLREYREIKSAYHPASDEGGDGVTMVEF